VVCPLKTTGPLDLWEYTVNKKDPAGTVESRAKELIQRTRGPPGKILQGVLRPLLEALLGSATAAVAEEIVTTDIPELSAPTDTKKEIGEKGLECGLDQMYLEDSKEDDAEVDLNLWALPGET